MARTIIKAGYGIYVGQNFTRLAEDTPIDIQQTQGSDIYGFICGKPDAKFEFMSYPQIRVRTIKAAIEERE